LDYAKTGFAAADDGTRLYWELGAARDGAAARPVVVLNDGIGCDGFAWEYIAPDLSKDHRVLHWHYRGHGRSGPPVDPARIDIAALARDLIVVLDDSKVERATLLGHSMGTQIALEGYRLAPARVAGLGLLCGSYGRVTHTFHGSDLLSQVLPRIIEEADRHLGLMRAVWSRVPASVAFRLAKITGELDRLSIRFEDFRRYWDHICLMDPSVFLPMLRQAGEHSAEDLLGTITVPTVVIAAERDTFTPSWLAEEMAGKIPGAEHVLVAGASHAAPVEQPLPMIAAIRRMLARADA
jgi:pimeloyl-ACP methyl ester carboxylesterase